MVDLSEEAVEENDALLASLMLCATHADAFNAPLTWTLIDNRTTIRKQGKSALPVLSLAHDADRRESLEQEGEGTGQGRAEQGDIDLRNAEQGSEDEAGEEASAEEAEFDMEDTPLLQRAFRSISS